MAFALLAVLPPVYGLYTSVFPPLVFFLMGSSRHTAIGPFAVVSILCGEAVENVIAQRYQTEIEQTPTELFPTPTGVTTDSFGAWIDHNVTASSFHSSGIDEERVLLHSSLCLLVGLIQMLMGAFHLGFVTVYLAQPLIRAFTAGAACHVITSQTPPLLGLSLTRYSGPLSIIYTWRDIFINLPNTNLATFLLGLLTFIILALGRYFSERYKKQIKVPIPCDLIAVIVTILISYFGKVDEKYGVAIVGNIPVGFPKPAVPSLRNFPDLFGSAIPIAIVGFAISVSVAKIFAAKNDYEVNSNQELLAYGASNTFSSFLLCFVSASALGRIAVLEGTGGKTQVSMVVSSIVGMIVLFVIGPLFEPLPKSVLAVIVMYALRGMIAQFADLRTLVKTSKVDCSIWLITWLSVFLLGVNSGLVVSVVYTLFTVIVRSQLPRFSTQGNLPGSELYRDVREYKLVKTHSNYHIFKMEASLYYVNAEQFKKALYKQTGIHPVEELAKINKSESEALAGSPVRLDTKDSDASDSPIRTIIIDASHFDFIDVVGVNALMALMKEFKRIGIKLVICSCVDSVIQSIREIGQMDKKADNEDDEDVFYPTVHDAVLASQARRRVHSTTYISGRRESEIASLTADVQE